MILVGVYRLFVLAAPGKPVIPVSLLRIAQYFVSLVDLLEARLGFLVVGVPIRMVSERQSAEGFSDRLRAGIFRNAQDAVVTNGASL
jgi:hypothetical protein